MDCGLILKDSRDSFAKRTVLTIILLFDSGGIVSGPLDPDRTARVCCILDLISDVYFGSDGSHGKESLTAAEVAGDAIPAASLA